jgi:glycine C-acetyltransferase
MADQLSHASIIQGIRLSKARRLIHKHNDMDDLAARLREAANARYRSIAIDGMFSIDGDIAALKRCCDLADRYDALAIANDSHCTGFIGAHRSWQSRALLRHQALRPLGAPFVTIKVSLTP